jgi:hypothetical protein
VFDTWLEARNYRDAHWGSSEERASFEQLSGGRQGMNVMEAHLRVCPCHEHQWIGRLYRTFVMRTMNAPKFPAQFSLFKQRGPRGFDLPTRYYDAEAEARVARLKEAREHGTKEALLNEDRARLSQRMRHSWQRQHHDNGRIVRLAMILVGVSAVVLFLMRGFGLLNL